MSDEKRLAEKKPNIFARMGGRIARYLREMRSELKKVVWPNRKQLTNNSTIVITAVIAVGIVIAIFDLACSAALNKIVDVLKV